MGVCEIRTRRSTGTEESGRRVSGRVAEIRSGHVGLVGGLAVSMFSRTLASLIGLLVCGVQVRFPPPDIDARRSRHRQGRRLICARLHSYLKFAASRGYNIVPTSKIQRYVKSIDLRSAIQDNVAFKLSFGVTFMLAAFAEF